MYKRQVLFEDEFGVFYQIVFRSGFYVEMYQVGKITPMELNMLKAFQKKTGIDVGLKIKEAGANPYAVGMAQAMKSTGDKPPLKKSTINKAHEIARAIKKGD